jgi:hypothetical protein
MVNLMSLVMVLWAITGGAMWWQMKNVRRTGSVLVSISIVWAAALGYLMFFAFKFTG